MATESQISLDTYSDCAGAKGMEPIGRDCNDVPVYPGTIVVDAGRDPFRVVSASKSVEDEPVFVTADQRVLIQSLVAVID